MGAAAGEEGTLCQGMWYVIKLPACDINSPMEPHYPIFVSLLISSMWVLVKLSRGRTIPWHSEQS